MAIELVPALTADDPPEIDPAGNTYADLEFANAYIAEHPQADCWPVNEEEQKSLLKAAMRLLEAQKFLAIPLSMDQPCQFPRVSENIATSGFYDALNRYWPANALPLPLKQAQCEIALAMADDNSYNDPTLALTQVESGGLSVDFRKRPGNLPNAARERLRGLLLIERGAYR